MQDRITPSKALPHYFCCSLTVSRGSEWKQWYKVRNTIEANTRRGRKYTGQRVEEWARASNRWTAGEHFKSAWSKSEHTQDRIQGSGYESLCTVLWPNISDTLLFCTRTHLLRVCLPLIALERSVSPSPSNLPADRSWLTLSSMSCLRIWASWLTLVILHSIIRGEIMCCTSVKFVSSSVWHSSQLEFFKGLCFPLYVRDVHMISRSHLQAEILICFSPSKNRNQDTGRQWLWGNKQTSGRLCKLEPSPPPCRQGVAYYSVTCMVGRDGMMITAYANRPKLIWFVLNDNGAQIAAREGNFQLCDLFRCTSKYLSCLEVLESTLKYHVEDYTAFSRHCSLME